MENQQVYVAVRLQEDRVIILGVLTIGHGDLAYGASRIEGSAWWVRIATPAVIEHEINKAIPPILADESRGFKGPIVDWQIVQKPEMRGGWAFRPSWRFDGKKLSYDMPEARDGYRNYLRRLRAKPLADLDVEYMRTLEQGGDTTGIVAQKQALRDVTDDPRIEAAQTVEDLLAIKLPE